MEENEKVMNRGGEPADGTPLLLGITKASLSHLRGLKENVIAGRLIPEPVPVQPTLDELLAREGEDAEEETLSLVDFEEEQ